MRTDYKTSFLCTILTICMVLTGTPYSFDNRNANHVLSYLNNINAGTGTVIVTGIGNYTGEIRQTFTIKPASLRWICLMRFLMLCIAEQNLELTQVS